MEKINKILLKAYKSKGKVERRMIINWYCKTFGKKYRTLINKFNATRSTFTEKEEFEMSITLNVKIDKYKDLYRIQEVLPLRVLVSRVIDLEE